MKSMRSWMLRLADIFSKQRREGEFADEIETHLQMQIEDNLRAGCLRAFQPVDALRAE
jgi:hypothetical protein